MAWTAPRTWVTGELVTAAIMNTHIRDNQTYLKTEVDKIDDLVVNDVTGSRALSTVYQNTTGSFKIVVVSVHCTITTSDNNTLDGYGFINCYIGPTSSPTTNLDGDYFRCEDVSIVGASDYMRKDLKGTIIVPDNYYYEIDDGALGDAVNSLGQWTEYDVH